MWSGFAHYWFHYRHCLKLPLVSFIYSRISLETRHYFTLYSDTLDKFLYKKDPDKDSYSLYILLVNVDFVGASRY